MALRQSTVAGILSDTHHKLIQAIGRVRDNTDLLRRLVIPADQNILCRMIDKFIETGIKTQADMERIAALYQRMIDTLDATGDTLYSDADRARFLAMFHEEGNIPDPMIEFIGFFEKLTLLPAGSVHMLFGTDDRFVRASEKLEDILSELIKGFDPKCFACPMFPLICTGKAVEKG